MMASHCFDLAEWGTHALELDASEPLPRKGSSRFAGTDPCWQVGETRLKDVLG